MHMHTHTQKKFKDNLISYSKGWDYLASIAKQPLRALIATLRLGLFMADLTLIFFFECVYIGEELNELFAYAYNNSMASLGMFLSDKILYDNLPV